MRPLSIGLGILVGALPLAGLVQAPSLAAQFKAEAMSMFAEARSGIAGRPAESAPEYYLYLAQQEEAAGAISLAKGDAATAFARALDLPESGFAEPVKEEVEPGVVAAMIEASDVKAAEVLAATADAGQDAIVDRLVPVLLERRELSEAWIVWTNYRAEPGGFAFHAASALLGAPLAGDLKAVVEQEGVGAAASVASMPEAEEAMDYFEECPESERGSLEFEAAIRRLAGAIPNLHGAPWEAAALMQRAAELIRSIDPHRPLRSAPPAGSNSSPPANSTQRRLPSDARPYSPDQALALQAQTGLYFSDAHLNELSESLVQKAPSYVLQVAHFYYDHNKMDEFEGTLAKVLGVIDQHAVQAPAPDQINFNGVELEVYGRAAQMDFATTRKHVEALPAGWLKPLALARVARMAGPAAANQPGKFLQVYH